MRFLCPKAGRGVDISTELSICVIGMIPPQSIEPCVMGPRNLSKPIVEANSVNSLPYSKIVCGKRRGEEGS